MKVKYVGPHASVVLTVDKTDIEVERLEEVEVPDDEGARLIEQEDNWEQVGTTASKRPAKKPARKTAKAAEIVNTDEASADAEPNDKE